MAGGWAEEKEGKGRPAPGNSLCFLLPWYVILSTSLLLLSGYGGTREPYCQDRRCMVSDERHMCGGERIEEIQRKKNKKKCHRAFVCLPPSVQPFQLPDNQTLSLGCFSLFVVRRGHSKRPVGQLLVFSATRYRNRTGGDCAGAKNAINCKEENTRRAHRHPREPRQREEGKKHTEMYEREKRRREA